ncbi:hypothetical protein EMIT0P395_180070 [Pseudomonas sp. IT-P395]
MAELFYTLPSSKVPLGYTGLISCVSQGLKRINIGFIINVVDYIASNSKYNALNYNLVSDPFRDKCKARHISKSLWQPTNYTAHKHF